MGINIENNRIVINPQGLDVSKFSVPERITTAESSFDCKEPVFCINDEGKLFGGDMAAFARLEQIRSQTQSSVTENVSTEVNFATIGDMAQMMVSEPDMCL